MKLKILVLDDDPQRHAAFATQAEGHDIDHVWFVDDAMKALRGDRYDLVCLDNDLETEGFRGREGFEVADFISLMPAAKRPVSVLVHSWNTLRSRQMVSTLARFYEAGRTLIQSEFGEFAVLSPDECEGETARGWLKPARHDVVLRAVPLTARQDWVAKEKQINPTGRFAPLGLDWEDSNAY